MERAAGTVALLFLECLAERGGSYEEFRGAFAFGSRDGVSQFAGGRPG
jgi:hypothetical protein